MLYSYEELIATVKNVKKAKKTKKKKKVKNKEDYESIKNKLAKPENMAYSVYLRHIEELICRCEKEKAEDSENALFAIPFSLIIAGVTFLAMLLQATENLQNMSTLLVLGIVLLIFGGVILWIISANYKNEAGRNAYLLSCLRFVYDSELTNAAQDTEET